VLSVRGLRDVTAKCGTLDLVSPPPRRAVQRAAVLKRPVRQGRKNVWKRKVCYCILSDARALKPTRGARTPRGAVPLRLRRLYTYW